MKHFFIGFKLFDKLIVNPLSAKWVIFYHKNTSESETISASNWKVIRDGENDKPEGEARAGKRSLSLCGT